MIKVILQSLSHTVLARFSLGEKKSPVRGPLNFKHTQFSPHWEDRIIPFFAVFVRAASEYFRNINFCSILEKVNQVETETTAIGAKSIWILSLNFWFETPWISCLGLPPSIPFACTCVLTDTMCSVSVNMWFSSSTYCVCEYREVLSLCKSTIPPPQPMCLVASSLSPTRPSLTPLYQLQKQRVWVMRMATSVMVVSWFIPDPGCSEIRQGSIGVFKKGMQSWHILLFEHLIPQLHLFFMHVTSVWNSFYHLALYWYLIRL